MIFCRDVSYSVKHPSGDGQLELLSKISGFCKPGEASKLFIRRNLEQYINMLKAFDVEPVRTLTNAGGVHFAHE